MTALPQPYLDPAAVPAVDAETARPRLLALWRDVLVVVALLAAGFAGSLFTQSKMDARLYGHAAGEEVYFNADVPRVYDNMTDRKSDHFRTKVHPLFLVFGYPPVMALQKVAHVSPEKAVRLTIAGVAAVWIALAYVVLRTSGSRLPDAVLFTLLLAASGAAFVWTAVPETYLFGSVSLLAPFLLVAVAQTRKIDWKAYAAVSAFSFSITVTNWMSGLAAAAVQLPRKTAFKASVYAFYAVVTVWGVQQAVFKNTPFFLDPGVERHVMLRKEWGGPTHNLVSALFSGMVLPETKSVPLPANPATNTPQRDDYRILTFQLSTPGSAGVAGRIAVALWAILLLAGVVGLAVAKEQGPFRLMLAGVLVAQLALHTVYGEEAFLYALHYVPLMVLVLAWGAKTRARPVILSLVGLLLVLCVYNNALQFKSLAASVHDHCTLHASDPLDVKS